VIVAGVLGAAVPARGASTNGTDRTKLGQLERKVALQGAHVQALVAQSNAASEKLAGIRIEIAFEHDKLAKDNRLVTRANHDLGRLAVADYVSQAAGNSSSITSFSSSSDVASQIAKQEYLGVAGGQIDQSIANLAALQHRALVIKGLLQVRERAVAATLTLATSTNSAAQQALNAVDASLSRLSARVLAQISAANARASAAKDKIAESSLASQQRSTLHQSASSAPVALNANVTPGTYENPLRSIGGLVAQRIDQGVDFQGFGPLYAVGDGVVLSTYNAGWPGGTYISYRLTDGPAAGLVAYAAEDIYPRVQIGQAVNAQTVIGEMYEGSAGIETGWAEPSGDGVTMASEYGQFGGSNSTAFGFNFSQFLGSLGADGGIMQNSSPSGSLPSGWPTF